MSPHSPARMLLSPRPAEMAALVNHPPAPKHRRHDIFAHGVVAASDKMMALFLVDIFVHDTIHCVVVSVAGRVCGSEEQIRELKERRGGNLVTYVCDAY